MQIVETACLLETFQSNPLPGQLAAPDALAPAGDLLPAREAQTDSAAASADALLHSAS